MDAYRGILGGVYTAMSHITLPGLGSRRVPEGSGARVGNPQIPLCIVTSSVLQTVTGFTKCDCCVQGLEEGHHPLCVQNDAPSLNPPMGI